MFLLCLIVISYTFYFWSTYDDQPYATCIKYLVSLLLVFSTSQYFAICHYKCYSKADMISNSDDIPILSYIALITIPITEECLFTYIIPQHLYVLLGINDISNSILCTIIFALTHIPNYILYSAGSNKVVGISIQVVCTLLLRVIILQTTLFGFKIILHIAYNIACISIAVYLMGDTTKDMENTKSDLFTVPKRRLSYSDGIRPIGCRGYDFIYRNDSNGNQHALYVSMAEQLKCVNAKYLLLQTDSSS